MNIVVLDGKVLNPGDVDWGPCEALGACTVYDDTGPSDLAERTKDADVVLVNKVVLGKEESELLSHVGFIGVLATGYNTIDLDAFRAKGIPVANVVSYGVEDVAQHAFALILELCRHISLHSDAVKEGEWARKNIWCYWKKTPICLANKTLGIVGYGAIGSCLGKMANAFGMRVLATNRSPKQAPNYSPFAFVSMDELFRQSDVISLHCPLTRETEHLVNAARLQIMRDGAILINTARGPLLDEEACAKALESGKLGGLGVDVLSVEPPRADNPLLKAPNTLITPHIAWATSRARQRIIDLMADNIRAWREGHPRNIVNGVA
ncbi:MAG: D-2-hydroxyacid dehydrogenase [Desulfovibrio sp.]|nr:D-2-hydroxyacid dehydrogenase [Desulfovibrio sp.]